MVAVPYSPNNQIHKQHYGSGLPTFRGSRMQYGRGIGSILKRFALPMLKQGAKILAPHLKRAAKGVVTDVIGNFMNRKGAMAPMPRPVRHKKRKQSKQLHRRNKKVKQSTSNIF